MRAALKTKRPYCWRRGNKSGQGLKKPPFHGSSEAHRDKPGGSPVGLMWDARKNCHAPIQCPAHSWNLRINPIHECPYYRRLSKNDKSVYRGYRRYGQTAPRCSIRSAGLHYTAEKSVPGKLPMAEPTIIRPQCGTEIKRTESLAAPLVAATRRELEEKIERNNSEVAKREAAIRRKEAAIRIHSLVGPSNANPPPLAWWRHPCWMPVLTVPMEPTTGS